MGDGDRDRHRQTGKQTETEGRRVKAIFRARRRRQRREGAARGLALLHSDLMHVNGENYGGGMRVGRGGGGRSAAKKCSFCHLEYGDGDGGGRKACLPTKHITACLL